MTETVLAEAAGENSQVAEAPAVDVAQVLYDNPDSTASQQSLEPENKGDSEAPQGAPEKYEFATPEGTSLDANLVSAYENIARELNLPQDKAQMVIDKMAPLMAKQQSEQLQAINKTWVEQAMADPEFGGDRIQENMAIAHKAMERFASPAFKELLKVSHMGNNPEVIRVFFNVGKAMSQDRVVTGRAAPPQASSHADRLYGKH